MRFTCRPVDTSFFDTAPMRFKNVVELDAPPATVFAIFDDEQSWPKWFRAIRKVVWTSNRPHGVGSTRTVSLSTATLYEYFFRWEQDRRCSFYVAHKQRVGARSGVVRGGGRRALGGEGEGQTRRQADAPPTCPQS